jgi:hypothetical protein
MATKSTSIKATSALEVKDQSIPQIIRMLQEKASKFKTLENTQFKTSGILVVFGDIKKETSIANLIRAYSFVNGKAKTYNEAAEDLGLVEFPQFEINGGSEEDWKHDIKFRINVVQHSETMNKLKELEATATKYLSEEDQKALFYNELNYFLKRLPV